MTSGDIVVVGSINLDILLFQDRLPALGETFIARDVREAFGGKGANQAVQCAKLGQRVRFLGAIGRDTRGTDCRANLERQGVDCHLAEVDSPTGLGVNNIIGRGELHATIVPGANAAVTAAWVRQNQNLFQAASFVILQNEIPAEANAEAIRLAHQAGARVVYNAAPADPGTAALLRRCDYLIVNEEEAHAYVGAAADSARAAQDVEHIVAQLRTLTPRVIVTLGAAGSCVSFRGENDGEASIHRVPPVPVTPVDTTGAGDSFVGAFTSALNAGIADLKAATIASGVAAKATMGVGAQTSMASDWGTISDPVRA